MLEAPLRELGDGVAAELAECCVAFVLGALDERVEELLDLRMLIHLARAKPSNYLIAQRFEELTRYQLALGRKADDHREETSVQLRKGSNLFSVPSFLGVRDSALLKW